MPDIIRFSYIPRNEIQIYENSVAASAKHVRDSVDFSLPSSSTLEDKEHVLVLDFADNAKGKKGSNIGHAPSIIVPRRVLMNVHSFPYVMSQAFSPEDMKKLIEKRNKAFEQAVDE
jgi:DEAD/DEAH box helicase domain-containing protein